MSDIHQLLFNIRSGLNLSLRKAAQLSGLSHSYIDSLEKGYHPKTKAPIKPSPDSLRALAKAYNYNYEDLMNAAGYTDSVQKESEFTLPESEYERVIKEAEKKYGANLRDDPVVNATLRELILGIAKSMSKPK